MSPVAGAKPWSHGLKTGGTKCTSCEGWIGNRPKKECYEPKHQLYFQSRLLSARLANKGLMHEQYVRHGIQECVCCASKRNLTADHILSDGGERRRQFTTPAYRMIHEPVGNLQGLCFPCNDSKNDGIYCQIHGQYLGLWNQFPHLDNIEVSMWEVRD